MINESSAKASNSKEQNRDVMYQVSLLQGLTYGDYCGSITVEELKQHGDIGIGTFDRLNGELIMLDGVVYLAAGYGNVEIASDDETTPFSVVTFMDNDESKHFKELNNYEAFHNELDKMIQERGKNRFYMIRLDGKFNEVNVRSVYAQVEPYKPLTEVLEHDQTFFDYKDIEGSIVGLYCPPYMFAMNAAGWHFHFISKDKTKGGHVLGLNIADAILTWDDTDSFQVKLTPSEKFSDFDLTVDQTKDIEKIEKSK